MTGTTPEYGLYLDLQTTQNLMYFRRGIPRYVSGQAAALLEIPGAVAGMGLNPLRPFPLHLEKDLLDSPFLNWASRSHFLQARQQGPLALYVMSPFELASSAETLLPPYAVSPKTPLIMTLYDLIPMMRPDYYLRDRDLAKGYYARLRTIRQADLVLTISDQTRRDAISLLDLDPSKLFNIGAGVSSYFHPSPIGQQGRRRLARHLPSVNRPFVLTVAGAEERKNAEGLITAFSFLPGELRRDLQLVVVCSLDAEHSSKWTALTEQMGLGPQDVIFTGLVEDDILRLLYQTAELFVFPSFYEGFGLPAAEAAACGCPVITSSTSSMPEILEYPPASFDPTDTSQMASLMQRSLEDGSFRKELRRAAKRAARAHTWEAVARKTTGAVAALNGPKLMYADPRPERLRLALAGPFPPLRSGIADYNLRLASKLSKEAYLDLLVSVGPVDRQLAKDLPGVRRFPLEALGKSLNPFAYDAVIYVLGNNEHHHTTYEKAMAYPGVLWLHDTQLAGLYISFARDRMGTNSMVPFTRAKLQAMYGQRAPSALLDQPLKSIEQYVEYGVGMTAEVVSNAKGVIVSSELAKNLVRLDLGPFCEAPPIRVVPLGIAPFQATEPKMVNEIPIIGSFGIGGWHKAPDVLVRALGVLRRTTDAHLVFVGPPPQDPNPQELLEIAQAAGVAGSVEFTGDVSEREYAQWLQQVDCAVQIRRGTHGENSAATNDCLAAGLPVVTNVLSCKELPPGTVEFVADPSPASVARSLERLLRDPESQRRLSSAGKDYANSVSFERVSQELVDFVSSLKGVAPWLRHPL